MAMAEWVLEDSRPTFSFYVTAPRCNREPQIAAAAAELAGAVTVAGPGGPEIFRTLRDQGLDCSVLFDGMGSADEVHPLKASEFWRLIDDIGDPGQILGKGVDGLRSSGGLNEDLARRISALTERATALAFEVDRLEQAGIRTLTAFDGHYPQLWLARLGAKAPPLLYGAGALELLDAPGVGVVGSRDVSRGGGAVAREVARLAAGRGLPLVSGGARGVDQLAMDAAFGAGGAVVGILAESLLRKLKRPDVRRAVYEGSTVMCTPYSPDAPFSAGNAMGRNKLIYAQAGLTVVVASDDGAGGTWSGATEALKHGYGSVAVWRGDGEGPGNGPLQQRGAIPVSSLDEIESLLDGAQAPPAESPLAPRVSAPQQQRLFAR
jgi:predicted Rossmann fold nucleotide-binding protein DprA/Smf involved in DNA uptake